MAGYKPFIAVPSGTRPITKAKLTEEKEKEISSILLDLAKSIIIYIKSGRKNGTLKQEERLYVRRRVGPLQYDEYHVHSGFMLKYLQKRDWNNAMWKTKTGIENLVELQKLKQFISKNVSSNDISYATQFAHKIIDTYFENLQMSSQTICKLVTIFLKDLRIEDLSAYGNVELLGLHLKPKLIKISNQIQISKVKSEDLDYDIPSSPGDNNRDEPFTSAFLKLRMGDRGKVSQTIHRSLIILRLFKNGSTRFKRYTIYSDSILFGGLSTFGGGSGVYGPAAVLTLSESKKLRRFWLFIEKYLTEDPSSPFTKSRPYLKIAYERYSDSLLKGETDFRISNAVMGLEALFLNEGNEEISFKLKNRAARLLSLYDFVPKTVYEYITLAYSIRSAYVHGSLLKRENVNKIKKIHGELGKEILLKDIQEYLRVSLANAIVCDVDKENLIKLTDNSFIDNSYFRKLQIITKPFRFYVCG